MPSSGVIPSDIDTGLDRPLTSEESERLTRWIAQAEALIGLRIPATVAFPDGVLAMVVTMAVERRWESRRGSGGESSITVAVDDGNVTRRYGERDSKAGSTWWFLPEWWEWLNPAGESGAFSTRPGFEPDRVVCEGLL